MPEVTAPLSWALWGGWWLLECEPREGYLERMFISWCATVLCLVFWLSLPISCLLLFIVCLFVMAAVRCL